MAKPDLGEVSGMLRKIHAQMVANANQRSLPRASPYPSQSRRRDDRKSPNPRLDEELARAQDKSNKLRRQERQLIEQEAKAQRDYQREREEFMRREKRIASLERRSQTRMDSERRKRLEDQLRQLKKEHVAQVENAKQSRKQRDQDIDQNKRELKNAARDERRLQRISKVEEKRLKTMEKMAQRPGAKLGNALLDRFAPSIQGMRGAAMASREQKRLAKISNMMVPAGSSPAAIQAALSGAKPPTPTGMAGLAAWAATAVRGTIPMSPAAAGVPPGGGGPGGPGAAVVAGAAGMMPPQAQLALKLWDAVKGTVTGSANMYDDLLKLSARYVKSTNQIPQTLDEAVSKLGNYRSMFTSTYADLIQSTMTFGASSKEAFKVLEDAVLRIRPAGADMDKQLKDITESTFIYARGFNMSTDQVFTAMEDSILRFGKSTRDVRSDLADMYSAFGDNIKRVDDFADIIFESARQANIWSLNYGEVASLLSSISKRATEAGMSEKRRQELAAGVAQIATQQETFTQQQVGERFIKDVLPQLQGMNTQQQANALLQRGVEKSVIPQMLDAIRLAQKEGGYGSQALIGELLNGSKLGTDFKFEALQKLLMQMSDNESRMLAVQKSGLFGDVKSLGTARQIAEFVRKGEFKQASALGGKTPEQLRAEAEARLTQGGARVTEMAATGLVDAMKNLTQATIDLKNVYASQSFGLLEKLLGNETTTQRMEAEAQLSSDDYKRMEQQYGISQERTALYKKHGITALGTEGGAFGAYATNIEQEIRTPEFQRMDESRQRMHLFKKFGDEGMTAQAASELVSQLSAEKSNRLRNLSSNQDFMALTPVQKMQLLQSEFGMTEEEAAAQLKTLRKDRGMPSPAELPPPAAGMPVSSPAVNPPAAGSSGVNVGVGTEVGEVSIDPQANTATVTSKTLVKIKTDAMTKVVTNLINSNNTLSSSANQ